MRIEPRNVYLKNGLEIILRSAEPSEAEVLLEFLKTVSHESYRNMNHTKTHWDNFPVEEEAKILADFVQSPHRFMISAFDGGRIVGNLGIFGNISEFTKHSARLGMGIVQTQHRQGLGKALIQRALEQAKHVGFHRIELTVRTHNAPAIQLYESTGFRRVGLLEHAAFIDGSYHDEYLYQILI